MRQKLIPLAILGGLLLVGGGCVGKPMAEPPEFSGNQPPASSEAMPEDADSAVADIIRTIDDEVGSDSEANDVSSVDGDSAEVSEFYDSQYEIE